VGVVRGGVFINYRGEDSHSYGALLHAELCRWFGPELVFLDSASIPAGADYVEQLLGRVRRARVVLAVIGSRWLTVAGPGGGRRIDDPADWIRRELVEAFSAGVRVIPVLTDGARMPTESELPGDLAVLGRCQFRRLRHRDATVDLARLTDDLAALDADLGAVALQRSSPAGWPVPSKPGPTAIRPAADAGLRDGPWFPGSAPRVWNLPVRTALFTGRHEELERVRIALAERTGTLVVQAVHGMGGVGKTQLALEYAYRHAGEYEVVWWVPAEQPQLASERLNQLADRLGLPVTAGGGVAALQEELSHRPRWLLIFDNAEDATQLEPMLPSGPGHVLITSRNPAWEHLAARLPLDVFDRAESVQLLRAQVKWLGESDADSLADALGDLPLALVQTAAFLSATGTPAELFRDLLRTRAMELLSKATPAGYPRLLAASWHLSIDRLVAEDAAGVHLLEVAAFLAPEPIPLSLFPAASDRLPAPLGPAAADPLAFRCTVARLSRYGLAQVSADTLLIHRLAQAMLRQRLSAEQQAAMLTQAQQVLGAADPGNPLDPPNWLAYSSLLPHLLAARAADSNDESCRQVLIDAIGYLHYYGDYHTARKLCEDAYQRLHTQLSADHDQTLWAAKILGDVLRVLRHYDTARRIDENTLARRRRAFGADHYATLRTAGSFAADLRAAGQLEDARHLDEDTLTRCRRVLGHDHPVTLDAANNLAVDLRRLGQFEKARQIDEDVLSRRRRILGEQHPRTLSSSKSLAADLRALGQLVEARKLDEHALALSRWLLGKNHISTIHAAQGLIADLRALGEIAAATSLEEDTETRLRRLLGTNNPWLLDRQEI
jgi:hypothetical protein